MFRVVRKFLYAEGGATAIEYGLIASLVFLVALTGIEALGKGVQDTLYNKIALVLQ